ncbi:hypothetical protein [Limosilactobacillus albertensis]|uniref:DUF3990 domain-containing protein n=1 Tax=Limosilactobacillus albertensis TaxID=2759752 RepID=A0A839HAA8_9LACO|nr:hypothetical protein [Limosilactobacillus albertensis]MBB1122702.1 hypothetical protein [Limosilactobacillus albertensis]MCD7122274.1 hypothetical protein [Limosilactobacillus albertensis]
MNNIILTQCFHGTTQENAQEILNTKRFMVKKRKDHWLGTGVYFFLEDIDKAKWFVRSNPYYKGKTKCVLATTVTVPQEKYLNLDTEKGRHELNSFINDFKEMQPSVTLNPEINNDNSSRHCFYIDMFRRYNNYLACKYTFTNTKTIKSENINAEVFNERSLSTAILNNNIQLCVFDQGLIDFTSVREIMI